MKKGLCVSKPRKRRCTQYSRGGRLLGSRIPFGGSVRGESSCRREYVVSVGGSVIFCG